MIAITPEEKEIAELLKTYFVTDGKMFVVQEYGHVAVKGDSGGLRLMLLVSSNAYRDDEDEIVRQKALEHYVESGWKEDKFVRENPLLYWHEGDPIGDVVYADMDGPFLVEVARERPDAVVNLAAKNKPPMETSIKEFWDGLEKEEGLGASIRFLYPKGDKEDGEFEKILKLETSVLPRKKAANKITDAEVLGDNND